MRLDKFLCQLNLGTRSQIKTYIRQGLVTVNGQVEKSVDRKVHENIDRVSFRGHELRYAPERYYMLNKPAGVVSATKDNNTGTVMELLSSQDRKGVFPVGRLDKDTEGLMILTNNGELAHRLLTPKRHVDKTYLVSMEHALSEEDILRLEQGVDIGEEHPTLPARVEVIDGKTIYLTVCEGKFHQVKRMLRAVGNGVIALKRISFAGLYLDGNLKSGEYRELTDQEAATLRKAGDA